MNIKFSFKLGAILAVATLVAAAGVQAKEVVPMFGGILIDGYDFANDIGPKGSIAFDEEKGVFSGSYNGLKMPAGRRAIFAWLHDTVNQKSTYLGPVGWLKKGTAGKNKGRFTIKVPAKYRSGNFGTNEIIAFSSERTNRLKGNKVVSRPRSPAGSKMQKSLKPAFYLFAKLPGADTKLLYCGHGQDFTYAKAPEKQICYD